VRAAALSAVVAAVLLSLAAPAAARAVEPSVQFAVDSPAFRAAQDIARAHWGLDPCGGAVTVEWVALPYGYNAISSWTNPIDPYDAPQANGDCRIEMNAEMPFGWAKLCTVVVHEYGHLAGQRHDEEPGLLMSAIYDAPLPACAVKRTRRAAVSPPPASERRAAPDRARSRRA
jgi:hypothetical protein